MDLLAAIPEDERDATWVREMLATAAARGMAIAKPKVEKSQTFDGSEDADFSEDAEYSEETDQSDEMFSTDPEDAFMDETDEADWESSDILSSTIIGDDQYPYVEENDLRDIRRYRYAMSFLLEESLDIPDDLSHLSSTATTEGFYFEGVWLLAPPANDFIGYLTFMVDIEEADDKRLSSTRMEKVGDYSINGSVAWINCSDDLDQWPRREL